jgi:hypothetical protein
MTRRRFMVLAVVLVAVNSFFWLAQGGFALPRAFIDQYFGARMIRAEVVVQTPTGSDDYLIDRGAIRAVTPSAITLREKDGRMVTIDVGTSAQVTGAGGRPRGTGVLRVGVRVMVLRQANAPAETIVVEGTGP